MPERDRSHPEEDPRNEVELEKGFGEEGIGLAGRRGTAARDDGRWYETVELWR